MRKEESERRRWQAAELAEKVGRSEAEQLEVATRAVRGTHTAEETRAEDTEDKIVLRGE